MGLGAARSFVWSFEAIREVVSGAPSFVPILACVLWFAGIACIFILTHRKVSRTAASIEGATATGQPPLALPNDIHPAILALIAGGETPLVTSLAATLQRLVAQGALVPNKESELLGYASLDVKRTPEGLCPIDEAAIEIVRLLSRATAEDRHRYEHFSRVYFKEYCGVVREFNDRVVHEYGRSHFLLRNTVRLHAVVLLPFIGILVTVAFGLLFGVAFGLASFLGVCFGFMAVIAEWARLDGLGELNAEGTSLREQLRDERQWCALFAARKTGAELGAAELVAVSTYAVACGGLTEFGVGLSRARGASSLALVPGLRIMMSRDGKFGPCALSMYVESIMHGWELAESYANSDSYGTTFAELSKEAIDSGYGGSLAWSVARVFFKNR